MIPATPRPSGIPLGVPSAIKTNPYTDRRTPAPVDRKLSLSPPPAPPKPRLVIHKLVLIDFKSYKGRQVIGPFHKSFSAIVGPNGSGKSNTIDALLFVFGYRANKMRQGKLSELIHNSEANSRIDSCTVEIHFREILDMPNGGQSIVPNSQLCVARTAFRNNSSKYTINSKNSSYGEVTGLLRDRGIDLDHKRFLILQGEVESIAQMKPKAPNEHEDGLLEYLEDIIGTSKYKEEINKALERVDEINEDRSEKVNRVKLVEKEKNALESRKKEADDFLHDQNTLIHLNSTLWQLYCRDLRHNIETAEENVELAKQELQEESQKQAGSKQELEELIKQQEEFAQEFAELEKSTEDIVKELAVFDRKEVQLHEKLKHLTSRQKKVNKTINDSNKSYSEVTTYINDHGSDSAALKEEMDELEQKLAREEAELEKIRDSLKDKTTQFSQQIEEKQRELQPWQDKVAKKKAEVDVTRSERDLIYEKTSSIARQIEQTKQNLESINQDNQAKKERLQELKEQYKSETTQLRKLESDLNNLNEAEEGLRSKASSAKQRTEEAKASQAASRSKGDVLTSLTKLREQGRLTGFHGRLGNLGKINEKYDVAISTACPGLDNLVCSAVENGQACIEHLRKNNLGRATILCLDQLANRDLSRIETPENAPRLFDLVEPKDEKYRPAFFQVLQNTLVAKDLEQANRIAYGKRRWRVVTLDGKLIDASGTMSGGGNRVAKGAMSSSFASNDDIGPEVIARFEKEREQAEVKLTNFLQERRGLESQISQLQNNLPSLETEMSKLTLDTQGSRQRIQDQENRITELESESKLDASEQKRIKNLESELENFEQELEELQNHVDEIENEIKTLQEKILQVGGVKLRTQQSKVSDIKEMMNHTSDRLTKADVGISKAEKDKVRLEKTLSTNQASLEQLESEISEVEQERKENSAASEMVRKNVEEAKEVMIDKKDELTELKQRVDERQTHVNKFRAREVELEQQVEKTEATLKENRNGFTYWQKKIGSLKLHEIDDDSDDDDDEEEGEGEGGEDDGEDEEQDGEEEKGNQEQKVKSEDAEDVPNGDEMDEDKEEQDIEQEQTEKKADRKPSKKRKQEKQKQKQKITELKQYTDEELDDFTADSLKAEVAVLEERIANSNPNLGVLKEYKKRQEEYMRRAEELERVTQERDDAKRVHEELSKRRLEEFMIGFGKISLKLKEMYQMITLGGNAELELVDSLDPFSEGIIFSVMPPKKSWKNIINLSGGEKTLSSLALVFALHAYKPTPLYFMDEIDAALDFRNVSIIANYIRSHTSHAQFIIISLRNNMFELASRLCGVFKTNNCTKSCTIENDDLARMLVGSSTEATAEATQS